MLKKKSFYIFTLILGIALMGLSFIFTEKKFSGLLIGAGAALLGLSISNLFMKSYEKKNPDIIKQNEIEFKDERNTIIRYKAKAKAGEIIQWFIMGIAYLTIIVESPLWVTLSIVGVFLLQTILGFYFMAKYQNEM